MIDEGKLLSIYHGLCVADEGLRRLKASVIYSDMGSCGIVAAQRCLRRHLGSVPDDDERLADFKLARALFGDPRPSVGLKQFAVKKFLERSDRRISKNKANRRSLTAETLVNVWLRGKKQEFEKRTVVYG